MSGAVGSHGSGSELGDLVDLVVDDRAVRVRPHGSLLEVLREQLGVRSAKDGCSPQGQCGCCTVLVDGQPRVACVTPASRVAGRRVTTVDGLDDAAVWADELVARGGSQCGFCTPGIVVRLAAQRPAARTEDGARRALLAHLCRCTGWQPIVETAVEVWGRGRTAETAGSRDVDVGADRPSDRDERAAAQRRAEIEGGVAQSWGPEVALGRGGFADDTAPTDCLVALIGDDGEWVVGETLAEARAAAGRVPGRRSTVPPTWPVAPPPGAWTHVLATTWVEPAYLEPDASWCLPGGEPASALGNGGAFGGKVDPAVERAARELADRHGRGVRALWTREDVVRRGPKRPPVGAGLGPDGRVVLHVARTPGLAEVVRAGLAAGGSSVDDVEIVEVDVAGPPTSTAFRAVGWGEVTLLRSARVDAGPIEVVQPGGGAAAAEIAADGSVHVTVRAGDPLHLPTLRSYVSGAAHLGLGWVRSESLGVDAEGRPVDLTIRSFGVLRAVDTPRFVLHVVAGDGPPVAVADATFVAVAAAAWRAAGRPPRLPAPG